MENWIASSMNHMQGWVTVGECCRHALEKGCLEESLMVDSTVFFSGKGKTRRTRRKRGKRAAVAGNGGVLLPLPPPSPLSESLLPLVVAQLHGQ